MKHSRYGLILLLSCGSLLACNGDPTSSIRDENPPKIIADPSVIFLDQGASTFLEVQLVDAQGNQLPADFEAASGGAQATVVRDATFLQTTNGTNLNTKERFTVTAVDAGQTTITVTAGGATADIPVSVVPTSVAATFSNAAPAVNEEVTITLPANFKFGPDAAVITVLDTALVVSFSADSTAINAVLPPGSTGPLTLAGVNASFLSGLALSLPTIDEVNAVGTPIGGATTAAASPIPVPALDATTTFFDGGSGGFTGGDISGDGGVGAQYYSFTVTEAGHYDFTTNWGNTADIDAALCFDAACSDGTFIGASADQPETGGADLTPGTYYVAVVLFAGTAPPFIRLDIEHTAIAP